MAEETVEWKLVLSIGLIVFTPAQEQFLTEFYRLCDRYKQAGIVPYGRGQELNFYELMVLIQLTQAADRATTQTVQVGSCVRFDVGKRCINTELPSETLEVEWIGRWIEANGE